MSIYLTLLVYFVYFSFAFGSCKAMFNIVCFLASKFEYLTYKSPHLFEKFHRVIRFKYLAFRFIYLFQKIHKIIYFFTYTYIE